MSNETMVDEAKRSALLIDLYDDVQMMRKELSLLEEVGRGIEVRDEGVAASRLRREQLLPVEELVESYSEVLAESISATTTIHRGGWSTDEIYYDQRFLEQVINRSACSILANLLDEGLVRYVSPTEPR